MADPDKKAAGVQAAAAVTGNAGVLDDAGLAANLVEQANQMKSQMANMEAEISRLMEEAQGLDPSLKPKAKRGRKPKVASA
jgi:hypothetical protein